MPLLPETIREFDHFVARTQANGRVPSLVAGVVRRGELAHVAGAGELPPPDAGTQYRIGSISKTLTASLVLRLRDEGRLSLDDPLETHLPGTPLGRITIRQILGHISGLQREPEGDWWERSAGGGVDALLSRLEPDKQAYPAHRGYHYSNLGYGLLGAALARITGDDWPSMVTKRLLAPLGMARTTHQATEPFARGYVVHPWYDTLREEPREDAGAMAPAGQLWSTVDDMAKWAAFVCDPDPEILAPASVAEMCAPVVMHDPESWTSGHGLGWEMWRRGERIIVGHTGSMPGYLAVLVAHRRSGTAVVGFANAYTLHNSSIADLGLDLLTAVLDREPAPIAPWRPQPATAPGRSAPPDAPSQSGGEVAPPAGVEELCGHWWWMGRAYEACWDATRGELILIPRTTPGAAPWRFTPESPNRWRGHSGQNDGEVLVVRRSAAGAVESLDIATFIFTRHPDVVAP